MYSMQGKSQCKSSFCSRRGANRQATRGFFQVTRQHNIQTERQLWNGQQILLAAHFEARCRISARACNSFESTALLVVPALSFTSRVNQVARDRSRRSLFAK